LKSAGEVVNSIEQFFIDGLRDVLGTPNSLIPLHAPDFLGNERQYVNDCISSTFVSSVGTFVDRFEDELASYTGARRAVAVVNGTVALQVALTLAGVNPNDEVLAPALSFVATANAISHCGAIPHFVDSDMQTLGLDPKALSDYLVYASELSQGQLRNKITGRRIAAIVPMHTYGHPVEMGEILEVAGRFGIPVVEDAAESLGSWYYGKHTGTMGLVGALSFNGNKIITTGGGGAILTNDADLANRAKHITTTAKCPHPWDFFHDEIAWNYRLPNLNAALGCGQLERLPDIIKQKRTLATRYANAFPRGSPIVFSAEPKGTLSNYWLNTVLLHQPSFETRENLLRVANNAGYQCRPAWRLLSELPMYLYCPKASLSVAKYIESSLINLPSSSGLSRVDAKN
jgi:perosamine synthetase